MKIKIIGYTLVLLVLVGLAYVFPPLWGVLAIIGVGYWIYVFIKWALK
jgi:hypothetical protein